MRAFHLCYVRVEQSWYTQWHFHEEANIGPFPAHLLQTMTILLLLTWRQRVILQKDSIRAPSPKERNIRCQWSSKSPHDNCYPLFIFFLIYSSIYDVKQKFRVLWGRRCQKQTPLALRTPNFCLVISVISSIVSGKRWTPLRCPTMNRNSTK